jgi:hypothetical protein
MRSHTSRFYGRARAAILVAAFCLSWPCQSSAQSTTTRREDRRAEMEARQRALHSVEGAAKRPPAKAADKRPVYREVAEDFEKLQLESYHISASAEPAAKPEYKQIEERAAEIKKRATRLKQALALPGDDDDDEQTPRKTEEALTDESLKAAILSLNTTVKSFAWNPIFQKPDVVDLEQSAKASRDLKDILRLCERIRKAARALAKSAGEKTQ